MSAKIATWVLRFTFHEKSKKRKKALSVFICPYALTVKTERPGHLLPAGSPLESGWLRGVFSAWGSDAGGLGPPLESGWSAVFKSTSYK